jgi:hypothetical protein
MELFRLEEETDEKKGRGREHRERDHDSVPDSIAPESDLHHVPRRIGVDGDLIAAPSHCLRSKELGVEPPCRSVERNDVAPVSSEHAEGTFDLVNGDRRLLTPACAFRHESAVVRAEDGLESCHARRRPTHGARLGPGCPGSRDRGHRERSTRNFAGGAVSRWVLFGARQRFTVGR